MRNTFLPYGKQYIDDDDIKAVEEVLRSDYLTTGPKIEEFESAICEYIGCEYAVAFSSGTAALHGASYAAGVDKGDEVITTAITFAASANCILYQGGTPIFSDINLDTFNIDYEEIGKKITEKTKAIIPVDFTGQSVDLDKIKEVIGNRDIAIIQDAAHSLGTKYKGEYVGNIADMTMFSFHPVKTITAGEGGIITTNNPMYYEKLKLFRSHGIVREESKLFDKSNGSWYYEQQELGYNYRMTDIQAALGISQLKKLDKFIKRRKEIVSIYNKKLSKIDGVILQKNIEESDTVNHLYIIRLDLSKFRIGRKEIFEELRNGNIGVHVHYIPVYYHPYYKELGYKKGICPNAEKLYEDILTLPLFYEMTDEDINDVVETLEDVLIDYRK